MSNENLEAELTSNELLHLAIHATNEGDPERAIRYLKQILSRDKNNAKAYYLLGALHAEIGMFDEAVIEIQKSVDLDVGLDAAHFQLGLLHWSSARIEPAEEAWSKLNHLGEEDFYYLFKTGLQHLIKDNFSQAAEYLALGIDKNTINEALNQDMLRVMESAKAAEKSNGTIPLEQDTEVKIVQNGQHVLLSGYKGNNDE